MKYIFLFIAIFLFIETVCSQTFNRCATDEHYRYLIEKGTIPEDYILQLNNLHGTYQKRSAAIVTIPVIFHVVYNNSLQNIPDARIIAQLDVLNRDFSRTNADTINTPGIFKPVAADTEIRFCLASNDPRGNATSGITRTFTSRSGFTFTTNDMKFSSTGGVDIWDSKKYLNVWIVRFQDQTLGFAQFPGTGPGFPSNTDGIVLDYRTVGGPTSPGTASPYHLGRTATHEVGHWLGLFHTFQNGCSGTTITTCGNSGDQVCDTPPVNKPTFGCPANKNTCDETPNDKIDMVMNFMDYTDDHCMNIFTTGQAERMQNVLSNIRSSFLLPNDCQNYAIKPSKDSIRIFPNPSWGDVYLNMAFMEEADVTIFLYNALGEEIFSEKKQDVIYSNMTLNLKNLSAGIYFLRIESNRYSSSHKIIIRK